METITAPMIQNPTEESLFLQQLVSRLVSDVMPATVRHQSFMVNEIPADVCVSTDAHLVSAVLSNMFRTIALHSMDSCIRISARVDGHVISIQVKDHHSANTYTIAQCLEVAQPIAEKIGGYLGVTSERKNETTIVFSFLNLPIAA